MNVVGHQTIAEYLQLVDLLPLSEVCQVVLIIAALDEHRLAVMAALNNMVGKTGYNHPGLSGHQRLLALRTQNPFCAVIDDNNRNIDRVGNESIWFRAARDAAKINLSRFFGPGFSRKKIHLSRDKHVSRPRKKW
jgi:hypothetical protein